MVQVFGTGDHLLIFYRHHLVRELTMDRSRSYQRLAEPGAATATATSCNWSCKPNRSDRAARQLGQAQSCPLLPVGRRGSRVKGGAGRRTVIATTTLELGGAAPLHSARRHPTTNQLSPMS
jgi:hypothetical protein